MRINGDAQRFLINNLKFEVEHEKEVLYFGLFSYNKANFATEKNIFQYINNYWSEQSPQFQKEVFGIYRDIDENFEDILAQEPLHDRLEECVERLFALHPFKVMRDWVVYKSGIDIPESFKEKYQEDIDHNTTEDKTYLQGDYVDLVTLSVMFRMMIPVWSRYLRHIKNQKGNPLKELHSFKLLSRTEIPDSGPIHKLLRYIKAKLKKENINVPVSMLSEEDIPYWNMTILCVKKICVGDISNRDPKVHLASLIHLYLVSQASFSDGDLSTVVRTKTAEDFGGDENKISTLEVHRTSMDISIEDTVEIPFGVENIDNTINIVCPDLPYELYERCLDTIGKFKGHQMLRPQKSLMGWILEPVISPAGIDYLDEVVKVKQMESNDISLKLRMLALVQAVLWHRGFKYLSLLSTSVSSRTVDHRITGAPTKERFSPEILIKLRETFPHVRVIQSRRIGQQEECFVINDIETIVNDVFELPWQPTASPDFIRDVFGRDASTRRLPVDPQLRNNLAKLAIAVGENKIANI